VVGDVHRAALPATVALLLAEELAEHAVDGGALGEAVAVPAVRARDVVVAAERLAHAHRDGLLADVEVREPRHLRAAVEAVDLLFEGADPRHLRVHPKRELAIDGRRRAYIRGAHRSTFRSPAISASTS
jgi:hypothetical protein